MVAPALVPVLAKVVSMYEEVPKLQEVVLWSRQIEGDEKAVSLVMEYAHYRVDLQDATVPLHVPSGRTSPRGPRH